ncbi:uncharacterized protein BJX67DRAFT_386620 [Aspergillus lucknowensis]|uniref:Uncharacterized protein n=1 Tax=Aspergillus lucknowensis TaxID=176173 RepID=A0ABR4L5Y1_9EURO
MAYSGLPKQRNARRRAEAPGRKSHLYYARRREQHLANGPTLPQYAPNTNVSAASLRGKWNRFCREAALDPDALLKNLTAADVKPWFDWIKKNFRRSIKAHGTLANYWRTLKRLYYLKNRRDMDPDMRRDCLNYMNQVSKEMGLRKLPLSKPTADSIDLLEFQVTHLVHCDSVFADEKQRLYPLVGLNLSSISACRAVSLFDTRHAVNPRPDGTFEPPGEEIAAEEKEHDLNSADSLSDGFSSDSGYDTGISGGQELTSEMDDDGFDLDYETSDGYTSDGSTVTDDGYLAGNEETGTILWRHVEFYIIRNPVRGRRNLLTAIVTLLHTKGGGRKPRIKRFVIEHEDNLLFDLLSQLLALGIDDDIFVATIRDVADIYTVPLPRHRRGIRLKIKRDKLDLPIFREPERTDEGYRTSILVALKARTWARYIKRIGKKTGQEENLTQKEVRRGAINAINNRAPASVRDQVADHESDAVKYYLNETVDFDTAAAFHKRASNEVVQREMRTATLVADNTAPIRLTEEQSRKISNHPTVRRLRTRCQQLTLKIHQLGYTVKEAQDDDGLSLDEEEDTKAKELCEEALEIGRQKKEADAELNRTLTRLRESALEKNRKRHFRNTDTEIFNRQYEAQPGDEESEQQSIQPNCYVIPEREEVVRLLCYSPAPRTDEEAHLRRLEFIRLMVRWQRRKESPRRGKLGSAASSQPEWETTTWATAPSSIAEKYDPLQCPFCLSDRRLAPIDRQKKKSKRNKLWDHVENMHKLELAAFESGAKQCGICDLSDVKFVPPSVTHFKNHTQEVHGIRLRA